jgi:hypothetical protein
MRRIQPDESCQSTPERGSAAALEPSRALRTSAWAPARRAMIPVALPQRFLEGVAWDEV